MLTNQWMNPKRNSFPTDTQKNNLNHFTSETERLQWLQEQATQSANQRKKEAQESLTHLYKNQIVDTK